MPIATTLRRLTRRGDLVEDMGHTYLARMLTLRGAMLRKDQPSQPLCADIDGFSLHAAVRFEAHDRKRLERLCRYITRRALSDERVQLNAAGQVELKTPCLDGITPPMMIPLKSMCGWGRWCLGHGSLGPAGKPSTVSGSNWPDCRGHERLLYGHGSRKRSVRASGSFGEARRVGWGRPRPPGATGGSHRVRGR